MIILLFTGYMFYTIFLKTLNQIGIIFELCQMTVKNYKIIMLPILGDIIKEVVLSLGKV
ncbi:hypothetical protein JCM14036_20240 [Desulfotomaculum defluvii]